MAEVSEEQVAKAEAFKAEANKSFKGRSGRSRCPNRAHERLACRSMGRISASIAHILAPVQ